MTTIDSTLAKEAASSLFDKREKKIRDLGHTMTTGVFCPTEKTYEIDTKVFINKNESPQDPKIRNKVENVIKEHYIYKSQKFPIKLTIRGPIY